MDEIDLKTQIEELKLALADPKFFIIDYFSDLISEIDLKVLKLKKQILSRSKKFKTGGM